MTTRGSTSCRRASCGLVASHDERSAERHVRRRSPPSHGAGGAFRPARRATSSGDHSNRHASLVLLRRADAAAAWSDLDRDSGFGIVNKRVLLLATTTGYQIRSFGEAAEKLGVRLVFASDRCDRLEDPWWDQAIPVRFHDEAQSLGGRRSRPPAAAGRGDRGGRSAHGPGGARRSGARASGQPAGSRARQPEQARMPRRVQGRRPADPVVRIGAARPRSRGHRGDGVAILSF